VECPFRVIAEASLSLERRERGDYLTPQCQAGACALWNTSLGQCGLVAQAYLTGLEVERKERGNKE